MIIRVVMFSVAEGKEDAYANLARDEIIPINKDAGCEEVYVLSKLEGAGSHGVVSVWRTKEQLDAMKRSEVYRNLAVNLRALLAGSGGETIYQSVGD